MKKLVAHGESDQRLTAILGKSLSGTSTTITGTFCDQRLTAILGKSHLNP